jgi:two-component system response regulator NreC
MKKIRVVLADDHIVLRSGLKLLLDTTADIDVVGEASNAAEALRITVEIKPDVLLLDITMPNASGIDAIREIKEKTPSISILILTMHESEGYLLDALKAGASGYVLKRVADNELIDAIKAVHSGEVIVPPSLTRSVVKEMISGGISQEASGGANKTHLSQREFEILNMVVYGYTNQQLAERLCLSVKSVETYKTRIMEKLNLHSRVELVRYALEQGLFNREDNP